ncbi:GM23357 [Drosophila sechellia]|uniref:GM23357 n=2 Tax=Drosophila sechellia TaxID=7238 RepID=B4IFD5_DROSE|nr:GM23357 [Drosophila sechellia]
MKIIALLVLAKLGFALSESLAEMDRLATWRLRNISNKYKFLSTGNPEFYQWIERVNTVADEFNHYNKHRQRLEDEITERLITIRSIIAIRNASKRCLRFYLHQEAELESAYKSSNERKRQVLYQNSVACPHGVDDGRLGDPYFVDYL